MTDAAKLNVLLVDDEPDLLRGLRRALRPMRSSWNVRIAVGAHAGLEALEEHPVDVVVSDMRMPDMDGAEFLCNVRDRRPETLRFILTGQASAEALVRAAPVAHQVLWKPCDAASLQTAIQRATELRDTLKSDRVARVVAQMPSLPTVPETYARLVSLLERPAATTNDVAAIVETDPALAAKTLQLANSALYGGLGEIDSLRTAIDRLGVDTIRAVTLMHGLATTTAANPESHAKLRELWDRSERVADVAVEVAAALKVRATDRSCVFSSGLLHAVGAAAELNHGPFPSQSYALIGGYLLALWGLPFELVGAVLWQQTPSAAPEGAEAIAACVHAACFIIDERDGVPQRQALEADTIADRWGEEALQRIRALGSPAMPPEGSV